MIRDTGSPDQEAENERARGIMLWGMGEMVAAVADHLDPDEKRLMRHVVDHWRDHKEGPSRRTLEDAVRSDDLPESQLALLEEYDRYRPQLKQRADKVEILPLFQSRVDNWRKQRFMFDSQQSRIIAEVGLPGAKRGDPPIKGVKDARNYLMVKLNDSLFTRGALDSGGAIEKLASHIEPIYQDNLANRLANKLTVPSGIQPIDRAVVGFDKKTLNLILGTIGHRKSAVARTIAYYAADMGFRVLFICLEWSWQEEIQIFAMMHAHSLMFQDTYSYTINNFRNGNLSEDEHKFLVSDIIPGFRDHMNTKLVIRGIEDKKWPNIRSIIEGENALEKLDLVVIDYIGLFDLEGARDTNFAMNQHVKEMKQMALHFNDDEGLVFVSPVHGNRKGYEAAKANNGAWQATDIYMYNEMEKSADTIMYTFLTDELKAANKITLGFCKTRRQGVIDPMEVEVDQQVGLVGGSRQRQDSGGESKPPVDISIKDPTLRTDPLFLTNDPL